MIQAVTKEIDLKRRMDRFLKSDHHNRFEVREFIDEFMTIGELAIFGGAVRDIGVRTNHVLPNDVDLVIKTEDSMAFEEKISKYNVYKNKFGGYRVTLDEWKIDIWELNNTWAFTNNYVNGDSFEDLVKTTFFDWDAVVYDLTNSRFYMLPGYIDKISSGVIDINLEPNPNNRGILERSLRFLIRDHASFSPGLAVYVRNLMEHETLISGSYEINKRIKKELDKYIHMNTYKPFAIKTEQLQLFDFN